MGSIYARGPVLWVTYKGGGTNVAIDVPANSKA